MKLFISYSRADHPVCKQIVNLLSVHDVWYDQQIQGGEIWWKKILKQLEWCEGFIYLLSPFSVQSDYCIREYEIARNNDKQIFPIVIQNRTEIPEHLQNIQEYQHIKMLNGIDAGFVADLLNALLSGERELSKRKTFVEMQLSHKDRISPQIDENQSKQNILPNMNNTVFNYIANLKRKNYSSNTIKNYTRWVIKYLEDVGGIEKISTKNRYEYAQNLPINLLLDCLNAALFRAWLGRIISSGKYKSSTLGEAKVAILNLVKFLQEAQFLEEFVYYKMMLATENFKFEKSKVSLISESQFHKIIQEIDSCGFNNNIRKRNAAIIGLCCILRGNEIQKLRWNNLIETGDTYFLRVNSSREQNSLIEIPPIIYKRLELWRETQLTDRSKQSHDIHIITKLSSNGTILYDPIASTSTFRNLFKTLGHMVSIDNLSPDMLYLSVKQFPNASTFLNSVQDD